MKHFINTAKFLKDIKMVSNLKLLETRIKKHFSLRDSGHDLHSEMKLFLFREKCFKSQMMLNDLEIIKF